MKEQNTQDITPENGADERSEILKRIEASNEAQARYARKQYTMSLIGAAANVLVLCLVVFLTVTLLPKVISTFQNLNVIMENVEMITNDLKEVDIEGMMKNIDSLVVDSTDSLNQAMKKINAIDIEKLNSAIRNLDDAVEPLANFANLFK